jgi:hypothetical protein
MKDSELRGIILTKFYEERRRARFYPTEGDFDPPIAIGEIDRIADQLEQHGLLDLKTVGCFTGGGRDFHAALGKITAHGIDVIEKVSPPPLAIEWVQQKNVTIVASSGVVVGDNNQVNIGQALVNLQQAIESANAGPAEKAEAKSRLRQLLEHPLVAAIAGAAATAVLGG